MKLGIPKKKALEILYKVFRIKGLDDPLIFQKFLQKVVGKVDYKKLAYGIVAYRKVRSSYLHPYPGTRMVLSELKKKGLRLAIISNAPKLKAWLRLAALRIDDYFDVIITADDVSRDKPSRLVFRTALRKLKLKPSSCLMVGDKPHIDIIVPNQIGMKTCFAKYGYMGEDIPKVEADFVIDNITELVKIV